MDPRQWLLTSEERDNPHTSLDDQHPDDDAWSTGNLVQPLIHGAAYFERLFAVVEALQEGDHLYFTEWQGDADELLIADDPDSDVLDVFARADERGVDVRGLVWRSHLDQAGFFAASNRHFGEQLQRRGAEVLLDMRVRAGGSHHQKFVVVRHRDDPSRDIAFIGGIDLAHNRRDDARHGGGPQGRRISAEYGASPPWHDVQVAIQGPAVHDIETCFRERWLDPMPLSMLPHRKLVDRLRRLDITPDPLPDQEPPPPAAGPHRVQLLRTYPKMRLHRAFPFAPEGERSVARGYTKAIARARRLVYVEDQYFWGDAVGDLFEERLRSEPDLHVMVVLPMYPDKGGVNRAAQQWGRRLALRRLQRVAPGRVAAYGIENHAGTPVYVHAKVCVIDDTWASTGSDNFNRRSWTHDSELSAVVLDEDYAQDLRLRLAAEHLDRLDALDAFDTDQNSVDHAVLREVMADCIDPADAFATFEQHATRLEEWYASGRRGERPPGRLRPLPEPDITRAVRPLAKALLARIHDPDGRPSELRRDHDY